MWLGLLGGLLIVVGLVADVEGAAVAGTAAGTVSLISVLVWRSQLIDAWRRQRAAASGDGTVANGREEW